MKVVVASPRAAEAFKAALRGHEVVGAAIVALQPAPLDPDAVRRAVEESDLVVFASGQAAYEAARAARLDLAGKLVAAAEGRKGAVMVANAFGVKPQLAADGIAQLAEALPPCRTATVFHHGERDEALADAVRSRCRKVHEFQPYTARRGPPEEFQKLAGGDVYVFFSVTAVKYAAEAALEHLRRARAVVAAGPAVAEALKGFGINPLKAPSGRIGDVALYVKELLKTTEATPQA